MTYGLVHSVVWLICYDMMCVAVQCVMYIIYTMYHTNARLLCSCVCYFMIPFRTGRKLKTKNSKYSCCMLYILLHVSVLLCMTY